MLEVSLTNSNVFYYILIFFILIYCFIKTIFSFHIIFINKVVFFFENICFVSILIILIIF